ncbi:unnamed protein product [Gadus morhua 'NCC']
MSVSQPLRPPEYRPRCSKGGPLLIPDALLNPGGSGGGQAHRGLHSLGQGIGQENAAPAGKDITIAWAG